jgi:hypothetical protein
MFVVMITQEEVYDRTESFIEWRRSDAAGDIVAISCILRIGESYTTRVLTLIKLYLKWHHLKFNRKHVVLIKPRNSPHSGAHAVNSRTIVLYLQLSCDYIVIKLGMELPLGCTAYCLCHNGTRLNRTSDLSHANQRVTHPCVFVSLIPFITLCSRSEHRPCGVIVAFTASPPAWCWRQRRAFETNSPR